MWWSLSLNPNTRKRKYKFIAEIRKLKLDKLNFLSVYTILLIFTVLWKSSKYKGTIISFKTELYNY